ncbi:MAG: hypothetical protein IBJ18_04650 [Phycisphaerales bacterium]|nr:hypothetical protein [Phycisphaerales bacterium]
MTLLLRAASCFAEQSSTMPQGGIDRTRAGTMIAIGRSVWPWGRGGAGGTPDVSALDNQRMDLIDADAPAQRLWAADLALRSGAFGVVIADGTGLDLASTRRLQLACESGHTACVLARPPWEERELSSACTRWRVRPAPREYTQPRRGLRVGRVVQRWSVDLLRCKGLRPTDLPAWNWQVEEDHAAGACRLVADVLNGPDSQGDAARRWRSSVG